MQWRMSETMTMTFQYSKFILFTMEVNESLHRPLSEPSLEVYNHPAPLGEFNAKADAVSVGLSMAL
mgnify:CR=1 FL=1